MTGSAGITQEQRQAWLMREDTGIEHAELLTGGVEWTAYSGKRFMIQGQQWDGYYFEAPTKWEAIDVAIIAEIANG